nr:olfactory receptor 56 [Gregopimpla kuwanae]
MVFENINGETFFLHKRILKISGLWPLDRWRIGPLFILAISSTLKIMIAMSRMIMFDQGIISGATALSQLWALALQLSASLSVRINSDSIVRLIVSTTDSSMTDSSLTTSPKEREIMKRHQMFGRPFFVVVPIFFVSSVILHTITHFPSVGRAKLTIHQQTALNDHYTWLAVYEVLFTVATVYAVVEGMAVLMLLYSLTMHLSGQFKILRTKFQKFLRIKNKNKGSVTFRRLVDRHNQLLQLTNDLRNSFSTTLAASVLEYQITICFAAYELALALYNARLVESVCATMFVAFTLWLLFVLYNSGEYLVTCAREIGEVFQQCQWYNFSKDERTNISIVMLQSRTIKTMTAAGMCKMNHSNYKDIVKAVYSYVTLILAITKDE